MGTLLSLLGGAPLIMISENQQQTHDKFFGLFAIKTSTPPYLFFIQIEIKYS